jgi:hypothetical protein
MDANNDKAKKTASVSHPPVGGVALPGMVSRLEGDILHGQDGVPRDHLSLLLGLGTCTLDAGDDGNDDLTANSFEVQKKTVESLIESTAGLQVDVNGGAAACSKRRRQPVVSFRESDIQHVVREDEQGVSKKRKCTPKAATFRKRIATPASDNENAYGNFFVSFQSSGTPSLRRSKRLSRTPTDMKSVAIF